jgi:hypothetical protein
MPLDLLSKICRELDERLDELRPLLAEHERLLDAAAALEVGGSGMVAADTLEFSPAAQPVDNDVPKPRIARTRAVAKPARTAPRAVRSATPPKPVPAARSAAGETILAALEHGSHTAGELAVVTAMSGPSINGNLRKLVSEGAVVKTEREGKAAWASAVAV